MLLYIEGTKIRNKTKCTPNFKMQWEPCKERSNSLKSSNDSELQIKGGIEDNSKIIFLISQQKHML